MLKTKNYSDEEVIAFRERDNQVLYSVLLNLWASVYQGTEKEPDFSKIDFWFAEVKRKTKINSKQQNGIWCNDVWYQFENREVLQRFIEDNIDPLLNYEKK